MDIFLLLAILTPAAAAARPWCNRAAMMAGTRGHALAHGNWTLGDDGLVFELPSCRLVRPSPARARRCLAGRHVMLVGDSLSRYMYLTLAKFMSAGSWESDSTLAGLSRGHRTSSRSACHESTFFNDEDFVNSSSYQDRWSAYFAETNRQIRGNGTEICDCFRTGCCKEADMTENRFTRVDGGGLLSFINQLKSYSWRVHGHAQPASDWEAMRASVDCLPGGCGEPPRWAEDLRTFARSGLLKYKVTDLILNTGHHWTPDMAPDAFIDELFAGACAAMQPGGSGAWWRTTTVLRKGDKTLVHKTPLQQPKAVKSAQSHGLNIMDFLDATMRLRDLAPDEYNAAFTNFDNVHYVCSVYRELNTIMLNYICDDLGQSDVAYNNAS